MLLQYVYSMVMAVDDELIEVLKKSRKKVGEIYPIVVAADDEVLDGIHRREAGWESVQRVDTCDPIQKVVIRYLANRRRKLSFPERRKMIDNLADLLIATGVAKPDSETRGIPEHLRDRPVVIPHIAELLGESETVIAYYISDKYKRGHAASEKPAKIKKRSKIEMRADMLRHLRRNEGGLRKTQLMYKSNLSWTPLEKNLRILYDRRLVDFSDMGVYITPLGRKVLGAYVYAEHWLTDKVRREITTEHLEKVLIEIIPESYMEG